MFSYIAMAVFVIEVNDHRLKAGGFLLRLEAGDWSAIRPTDYTTSKSSSGSGGF